MTFGELIGAGTKLEALSVVAACSAAFYVGAVIGSLAVATGRSLSGGTSMSEVLFAASKYRIDPPWLLDTLQRDPGICDPRFAGRRMYRYGAAVA